MVRRGLRLSALDWKLLRDLWEMKGQALAIASVIAAGVTMFVAYLSNFDSLQRTRADYYEQQRLADVFASLVRAPQALESRLAAIPGVQAVATRVVADVTLDVPGLTEPASGRLVSLPARGRPALNDVYLRSGRWIDPRRPDEVLASETFCEANGFVPGDRVVAIINGRRRALTIVGIALSPEYVYASRPGEMIPDRRRYGIFWMGRQPLGSAFDMEGGFNDVALRLARDASEADVIAAVDRLLEPYGGLGAIPQRLQMSAWTLENELSQLQTFGFVLPLIFLGVAAFILNVALTRALALQRAQIAALKALGYSNRQIAWHYIKWGLVIAVLGTTGGIGLGAWFGSFIIELYNRYFRFPSLDYHLTGAVAAWSLVGSMVVAALGAQSAVRRAVRVPPAEAMRPEAPARYRASLVERLAGGRRRRPLTLAGRMVLRNIERQPFRALMSITGIALAVSVLFVGMSFLDVMERLIDDQFNRAMRQDATVAFVRPRSSGAFHEVQRLPGVLEVEPLRAVPARLRAGHRSRTLTITGLVGQPRLNRVVDRGGGVHALPPSGLVMSQTLGEILGASAGDTVQIEVLEGHRPTIEVTVAGLVDDGLGLQAYMRIDALHRALKEGDSLSGAYLTVDDAHRDAFYRTVKLMPSVAGVALRDLMIQNFRATMAENMNLQIIVNVLFAGIIAFGVVYNAARVSLSERERELASLRVLGFTRGEISLILLGELAVLTVLALPVGAVLGYGLGHLIMASLSSEVYRLSFVVTPATVALTFLVVMAASFLSGLIVRRRLDRLDLVGVLKTRE